MEREKIEVVIAADGTVELKVCGVKGPDCTEITKSVEKALGGTVIRTKTHEYYESSAENEQRRQVGE